MAARPRFDRDYYAILGLGPDASDDDMRRAYRRLALRWHPDRNPGNREAEERFKEISEAYGVLIDPLKRHDYDRARRTGSPADFHHTREEVFHDLFTDPRASTIFDELCREFERLGMRVDRHDFRQTLFGGRAVVTGGVFVITPFTAIRLLAGLARTALGGAATRVRTTRETPSVAGPGGVIAGARRIGRWLLGRPLSDGSRGMTPAGPGAVMRIRLSRAEAERGGPRRITLDRDAGGGDVLVKIPPGVRSGTRLRLRARGRAGADLYLAVEVQE
jgi:curved DNA-binding protein